MRFLLALLIISCAGSKTRLALAQRTDNFVLGKSCEEVWPVVKDVLEEHHFPGFPKGDRKLHLETAMLTASGDAPGVETLGGARPPMQRGQTASQHGMRGGPVDRYGSEVMRFVVDGEVIDATHCKVRFVRHVKDNIDASENEIERDPYMELDVIARIEPERAEEIRKSLAADGIELK